MRQILLGFAVFGIVTHCGVQSGFAQQPPQRRPLTITYRPASVTRTQWSPDSGGSSSSFSSGGSPVDTVAPNLLPGGEPNSTQNSSGYGMNNAGSSTRSNQSLISNQQLQNPSGGFNLSHSGFSQNQYVSPNNYFGSQFHAWSNMGLQPTSVSPYGSFNRFQPPINSGGYSTPMTYIGAANNQWCNLSSGVVTPNFNGGWSYGP